MFGRTKAVRWNILEGHNTTNDTMQSPAKKRKFNRTEKSKDYFVFSQIENGKHIYECKHCHRNVNGTKPSNLSSHLQSHPEIYMKLCQSTCSIEYKRARLLLNCVELVTVNGRPFKCLNDSAIQNMNEEVLSELKSNGRELNLHDPHLTEIKAELSKAAEQIVQKIANEVKDRALSLLVDIVTKRDRSIFGVSVQYTIDSVKKVRCIGMINLEESHTGLYLADLIVQRLLLFGVNVKQVITMTTDNGSNVLKMVRDLDAHLQSETSEPSTPTKRNRNEHENGKSNRDDANDEALNEEIEYALALDDISDEQAMDMIFNGVDDDDDDDDYEPTESQLESNTNLLEAIKSSLANDFGLNVIHDVTGVNCAEHTLQLGIKDSIKATTKANRDLIKLIRRVAKHLRLATTERELNAAGVDYKRPHIDVATRWGSLYVMVNMISRIKKKTS